MRQSGERASLEDSDLEEEEEEANRDLNTEYLKDLPAVRRTRDSEFALI